MTKKQLILLLALPLQTDTLGYGKSNYLYTTPICTAEGILSSYTVPFPFFDLSEQAKQLKNKLPLDFLDAKEEPHSLPLITRTRTPGTENHLKETMQKATAQLILQKNLICCLTPRSGERKIDLIRERIRYKTEVAAYFISYDRLEPIILQKRYPHYGCR